MKESGDPKVVHEGTKSEDFGLLLLMCLNSIL